MNNVALAPSDRTLSLPPVSPNSADPVDDSETYRVLLDLAHKRTASVPPEIIVRHLMEATAGADWPVRRAALDALFRRLSFARRDGLKVGSRPQSKKILGVYSTRSPRAPLRPYVTTLLSVDPLAGSCDCADFQKNALGLCKHILVVVDSIYQSSRKLQRARAEQARGDFPQKSFLTWDPVRPMQGAGDWLERVVWRQAALPSGKIVDRARAWFEVRGGLAYLRSDAVNKLEERMKLVADLLALTRAVQGHRLGSVDVDSALARQLQAEHKRLDLASTSLAVGSQLKPLLKSMKIQLYPYQLEGVRRFFERGRLLLADDMGLGKTSQAVAICHALWHSGRARRGLLIVPASLKPQWKREWQRFTDVPVEIVAGSRDARRALYQQTRSGFLISNYEQVLRDLEIMHGWQPDVVVLDEAQRIKNWATKTAHYVKKLEPSFRLVLTGTPMENRLDELASIMDWIDETAIAPAWRLLPWHCTPVDGQRQVGGARHLNTLRQRLAPWMIRRQRQEVLDQLPPRTDTQVPVEMTERQSEAHDELTQPIMRLMQAGQRRPLSHGEFLKLMMLLARQRMICNGMAQVDFEELWPSLKSAPPTEALLRGLDAPKLLELRSLLGHLIIAQGRKVVVFSQWRRMLRLIQWALSDILGPAGRRAVFFSGEERQARRTQNLVDFHDDPQVAVLLCTDAGGVGLNLQRAASCCINVELPWNPAVLEQRIGRIYRIGQTQPIEVYNLVSAYGIESRIAGLVANKRAMFRGLFDGDSDEVCFDGSGRFLSRLEKIVDPVDVPELASQEEDEDSDQAVLATVETSDLLRGDDASTRPERASPVTRVNAADLAKDLDETGSVPPGPVEVAGLFKQLKVQTLPNGGVTFTAPAEAAQTLAALFQGMAQMLGQSADLTALR